jgi:tryptophanyl-tRNA synthetase
MSKSYENAIYLKDTSDEVWEKLRPMITDPARVRRTDPGDPKKCPVFDLHKFFSTDEQKAEVTEGCTTAGIGCIDCKKILNEGLEKVLAPIREQRAGYEKDPDLVKDVLNRGNAKALTETEKVMQKVREAVHIYQPKL